MQGFAKNIFRARHAQTGAKGAASAISRSQRNSPERVATRSSSELLLKGPDPYADYPKAATPPSYTAIPATCPTHSADPRFVNTPLIVGELRFITRLPSL